MSVMADGDRAFLDSIIEVADEVAGPHADSVDRDARFPAEALDALRAERALSATIPPELGGGGISFSAVARGCFELGRRCGSTAMVFAMHHIQVATIARHAAGSQWLESYLASVAADQRLVASVTTELGTGGDMGRSIAALQPGEDGVTASFEKQAPVISYGAQADDLFVTLRRSPDAEQNDQVIAVAQRGQFALEQTGTWDPLGMRGTCSPGFVVRAQIAPEQTLATPFPQIMAESMVPITHILWSHLWLGIATDAFDRARAFVRAAAKGSSDGAPPPVAIRLSHLLAELSLLRAEVASGLAEFVEASEEPSRERLLTMTSTLRFNNLKIAASEQAPRVCQGAMGVCGIMGFKNDSPYSVGRHLRDTMSASLMIANERIHQTNASLLLIAKDV
jgi:acyl-CoA dehydrogenase